MTDQEARPPSSIPPITEPSLRCQAHVEGTPRPASVAAMLGPPSRQGGASGGPETLVSWLEAEEPT